MSTFYEDYYAYAPSEGDSYGDYSPQQNSDIVGLIADNDRYRLCMKNPDDHDSVHFYV
jgi:hypothetical protein